MLCFSEIICLMETAREVTEGRFILDDYLEKLLDKTSTKAPLARTPALLQYISPLDYLRQSQMNYDQNHTPRPEVESDLFQKQMENMHGQFGF